MNQSVPSMKKDDIGYMDEKELFILYSLLKNKYISTMWSNVFVPNDNSVIHLSSDNEEDRIKEFEEKASGIFQHILSKEQSSVVFSYLLELGKEIDEEGFSLTCNADYALIEGGFLSEHFGKIMLEYLEDTLENRKKLEKYKVLNDEHLEFLNRSIKEENFDEKRFHELEDFPVKEYREAILNKEADADFIVLVNKLITEYDGGKWDKNDAAQFLDIYYRHNKERFKNAIDVKTRFGEDYQTELAKLIFRHIDIRLSIKNTKKLEERVALYVNSFKNDELSGISRRGLTGSFFSDRLVTASRTKFFGIIKQKDILSKHIASVYEKYKRDDLDIGNPYVEPRYLGDGKKDQVGIILSVSEDKEKKDLFLFVHTMIVLEFENQVGIENFSYGPTEIFDMYDRGFLFKVRIKNHELKGEKKVADGGVFGRQIPTKEMSKAIETLIREHNNAVKMGNGNPEFNNRIADAKMNTRAMTKAIENKIKETDDAILIDRVEELERKIQGGVSGKKSFIKSKKGDSIKTVEIIKNNGRVKVYINGDCLKCLEFARKKYWGKMYELAENGSAENDKNFLDYFNSNKTNPLYKTHGFAVTQILKIEDGSIVKNIEKIELVTQKKITQRLKTA